jgi:hypothetical protein
MGEALAQRHLCIFFFEMGHDFAALHQHYGGQPAGSINEDANQFFETIVQQRSAIKGW